MKLKGSKVYNSLNFETEAGMALKKSPVKMLVSKQRQITVYYTPEELQGMKHDLQKHTEESGLQISHGSILKNLGELWRRDSMLQARVRKWHLNKQLGKLH